MHALKQSWQGISNPMKLVQFVLQKPAHKISHLLGSLPKKTEGNAAIEFAVVAPIFAIMMVGSIDFGALLFARFQLEAAISNDASYAIVHADEIDGSNDSDLAKKLALMIAGQYTASGTSAMIVVNNGASARYDAEAIKLDGTPSSTAACYCPTGVATTFRWGSQQVCSSTCPDGASAGKYVVITAKQAYAPMFYGYNLVQDGYIYASAAVQVK